MDYTKGQRFRLKSHVGYDPALASEDPRHPRHANTPVPAPEGGYMLDWHTGMHPLFAGQVGEVVGVVPAGVAGAGQHGEEVVVLQFGHRQFVGHGPDPENPMTTETDAVRNVSFTQDQMDELFEPEGGA